MSSAAPLTVEAFTIYHSANSYLGMVLLRRALEALPRVQVVRRPILIPRARGVLVADLGLDGAQLLTAAAAPEAGEATRRALADFDRAGCPGVPTFVLEGERFFGKDRVDWLVDACRERLAAPGA
jgi:2-hydroxychromene-2-carboxylate isomerase